MSAHREPQHGYREWLTLRCDHCNKEVSGGNGYDNAVERMPEESIFVPGEHKPPLYRFTPDLHFCDEQCRQQHDAELYGEEGSEQ